MFRRVVVELQQPRLSLKQIWEIFDLNTLVEIHDLNQDSSKFMVGVLLPSTVLGKIQRRGGAKGPLTLASCGERLE
jgi:hypothetical protein